MRPTPALLPAFLFAAAPCLLVSAPAGAVTLTVDASSPVVDQLDIANLGAATGGSLIWSDRPVQGQTFTTGGQWGLLNSVSVQIAGNDPVVGWKDYLFRFGSISGSINPTIDVQVSETIRQDSDVTSDWFYTFTFDAPVLLQPNTQYGFDVGLIGSQAGWQAGIPSLRTTGDVYAGGQSYDGGRPATPGTSINTHSNDKVFHADIDDAPGSGFLTMRVDTTTGGVTLVGGSFVDIELNYYQVTSAGDSLNPAGWLSLADQDMDGNGPPTGSGNGWEEAGGNGTHALAEGYLLGMSAIAVDQEVAMGAAYNAAVDARDLAFIYRTSGGDIFEGIVEYVTTALPGDTDGDGDIDDADLGTAFSNFTGPLGAAGGKTAADGDTDGDGDMDDADLANAFSGFTGPLSLTAVPEPGAISLLAVGAFALLRRNRK